MNRDGHVNASDIAAMEQALVNPSGYQTSYDLSTDDFTALADMDNSGTVDNSDLQSLLQYLSSGGGSVATGQNPAPWVCFQRLQVFWRALPFLANV